MVRNKIIETVLNILSTQLVYGQKVRQKIRKINASLAWSLMRRWRFRLVEPQEETPVPLTRRPETDSFVRQEAVIGREEDREKNS